MNLQAILAKHKDNLVILNPCHMNLFGQAQPRAVLNKNYVYDITFDESVPEGSIQINQLTKITIFLMDDCGTLTVDSFRDKEVHHELSEVQFFISLIQRTKQVMNINNSQLETQLKKKIKIINHNANIYFEFKDIKLELRPSLNNKRFGFIVDDTTITCKKENYQKIQIVHDSEEIDSLFENMESKVKHLKVGGLKEQLELIERRVFHTRMLHPQMMKKLGIKHIKGMLLHGPPGTGKTLIAREISKILKVEPKIVNGPEILNQFVGKSEEKIRELFKDAIQEQEEKGQKSQLHCIILDQVDAICKKRGTQTSSAVYDLIVNQLLTCIDGINALNNILVIGITNRKDLIDEAILRPGRLEVHIEVNIPDEKGRLEVLEIHTEQMKKSNCLHEAVDLAEIAKKTKNYTGAELEGVVKSAQSFALEKWKQFPDKASMDKWKVSQSDFEKGISEVTPQFGRDNKLLQSIIPSRKQIVSKHQQIKKILISSINKLGCGKHTFLIRGEPGVGKTVIAAELALASQYPFTKLINCDRFLGLNQSQITNQIVRIFQDADKCPISFIILDDILRLIDFIPLGPKYNSDILNLLINLIKKVLDPSKKQIIVATVSTSADFQALGMLKYFKHSFELEKLREGEITEMLSNLGFDLKEAEEMSKEIKSSTLHELIDTTDIEGSKDAEAWLRSWKQSTQGTCIVLDPQN